MQTSWLAYEKRSSLWYSMEHCDELGSKGAELLMRPVHSALIRGLNSTEVKHEVIGKRNENKTIACNDNNIIQSNRFILKG